MWGPQLVGGEGGENSSQLLSYPKRAAVLKERSASRQGWAPPDLRAAPVAQQRFCIISSLVIWTEMKRFCPTGWVCGKGQRPHPVQGCTAGVDSCTSFSITGKTDAGIRPWLPLPGATSKRQWEKVRNLDQSRTVRGAWACICTALGCLPDIQEGSQLF